MRIEASGRGIVERPLDPALQTMAIDRVFWSHFSPNLAPSAWVIGVLVGLMGLDVRTALLALVAGNVIGGLPVALCAAMGPATGLPQIEASRLAFGMAGKRVPALINWASCVGWDAVNNVPSTVALVLLARACGVALPFWLALGLLALAQVLAGAAGHDVVQAIEKYLGWVLLAAFACSGGFALLHLGAMPPHGAGVAGGTARGADLALAIGAVASFNLAWAAYASDYTRYLPRGTPPRRIIALTFGGVCASALMMEMFGLLTARAMGDASPGAVIAGLGHLAGPLAPLALAAIALSSVAINAANDNTAAYALMSAGIRLSRPLSAGVTAGLAYLLSVAGAGRFAALYENYLLLALYWIAPWCGIVLADWYGRGRAHPRDDAPDGWAPGASLFVGVTVLTILLFSATPLYTGPVARALGGVDIGYLVGFVAAAAGQALLVRRGCVARPVPEIA